MYSVTQTDKRITKISLDKPNPKENKHGKKCEENCAKNMKSIRILFEKPQ